MSKAIRYSEFEGNWRAYSFLDYACAEAKYRYSGFYG